MIKLNSITKSLIALVTAALFLGVSQAIASTLLEKSDSYCFIRVMGTNYLGERCSPSDAEDDILEFGYTSEQGIGHYVRVERTSDGGHEAYLIEQSPTEQTSSSLGSIEQVGGCWRNNSTIVCADLATDAPAFFTSSIPENYGSLMAHVDGIDYEVLNIPLDHHIRFYSVVDTLDLDGQPGTEVIVSYNHQYGNCCPPNLRVVSYKGDGFFAALPVIDQPHQVLEETAPTTQGIGTELRLNNVYEFSGGWGGVKILKTSTGPILRVHDVPIGPLNENTAVSFRDYRVTPFSVEYLGGHTNIATPHGLASLDVLDFISQGADEQSITWNIDGDDTSDEIRCSYWERWGMLRCSINLSSRSDPLEVQCLRVSILPKTVGGEATHPVACGSRLIDWE